MLSKSMGALSSLNTKYAAKLQKDYRSFDTTTGFLLYLYF